jgi:hypothetical protein
MDNSFTKTKAMKELLAERSRARQDKEKMNAGESAVEPKRSATGVQKDTGFADGNKEKDLSALVKSVKRKMENQSKGRKRTRK